LFVCLLKSDDDVGRKRAAADSRRISMRFCYCSVYEECWLSPASQV